MSHQMAAEGESPERNATSGPNDPPAEKDAFHLVKTRSTSAQLCGDYQQLSDFNEPRRTKFFNLGQPGSGIRPRGPIQDFHQIQKECFAKGKIFEDPEFPADFTSLFYDQKPHLKHYEWKRPSEICKAPKLITKGISRFDVQQGQLGNCWFAAAIANISLYKRIVDQIIPKDQDFEDQYAGVFHFRFWRFGRWVDVVIDDSLPTLNGHLTYLHSSDKNEFWSALLEKAYAKLHGSYQALDGGRTSEAMVDFTGGISESFVLKTVKENNESPKLFKIMKKGYDRSSVMGCSIEADANVKEAITPEGLVKGHAYSITKVAFVSTGTHRARLIRIRNPWGNNCEWSGAWSDKSQEWNSIPFTERKKLGLSFENDGEFWMSYEDFLKHFSDLEICHLNPDTLERGREDTEARSWVMNAMDGKWVKGVSAGGCPKYLETFKRNPVYTIKLEDPDEDDDESNCTVIVSLMQKNRRALVKTGIEDLFVGFAIYDGESIENLTSKDIRKPKEMSKYSNDREITRRYKLPPGTYCIVPSTYEPNQEGDFLLRVFSETKNNMQDAIKEIGLYQVDAMVQDEFKSEETRNDEEIMNLFIKNAGKGREVNWNEVKELLEEAIKGESFSKDVCRSMVAMMDNDRSGKLGFWEFQLLLRTARMWKRVFEMYDKNNSGTLDISELRGALHSAGFSINTTILSILVYRYTGKNGKMSFDDFLMCAVKLKGMIDKFNERTNLSSVFTLEEWLDTTLYL